MVPDFVLELKFFERLNEIDRALALVVRSGGCDHCGGRLHFSNYQRKPRGGRFGASAESQTLRYSLCCGQNGCRKRALPPSVRFLGQRVYVGAVVLLASVWAQVLGAVQVAATASHIPVRTLQRWGNWWRGEFEATTFWQELRARFVPPAPASHDLPRSLLEHFSGETVRDVHHPNINEALLMVARHLSPITTKSVADSSKFAREYFSKK
jgi:hypothetical protein